MGYAAGIIAALVGPGGLAAGANQADIARHVILNKKHSEDERDYNHCTESCNNNRRDSASCLLTPSGPWMMMMIAFPINGLLLFFFLWISSSSSACM